MGRWRDALDWLRSFSGRYDCEPARTFLEACAAGDLDEVVAAHALFASLADEARLAPERRATAAERAAALATHPDVLMASIDRIPNLADAVEAYARISERHPTLARPWSERGVGLVMRDSFAEMRFRRDSECTRCWRPQFARVGTGSKAGCG